MSTKENETLNRKSNCVNSVFAIIRLSKQNFVVSGPGHVNLVFLDELVATTVKDALERAYHEGVLEGRTAQT